MDYLRRALGSAGESAGPGTQFIIWKPSTRFDVSPQMLRALDTASGRLDDVTAVVPAAGLHTGESIEAASERLIDAHTLIMAYEAVRLRAREASCPQELSPQLARLFADGRTVPEDKYVWAVKAVDGYKSAFRQLLQGGTVLLGPAAQSVAPVGLEATGSPVLSRHGQALGFPVLAVPGFRDDETGLPLGLQLVGAPGEEDALFAAGHLLESVL
jgi:Asp-tRNA(Asn)/Glu-tRNA(Gln) amidotransferase A subunit family amidase